MTHPPEFYEQRLQEAKDPRYAVWMAAPEDWERVRKASIIICQEHMIAGMRVLDAGCGIGELTECLPDGIQYIGVDLCPGFIEVARKRYPNYEFHVVDMRQKVFADDSFDLVVFRTVEGTSGKDWPIILQEALRLAPRVLVFRATLEDGGTEASVYTMER